jgi:NAD(P)-dependent dehydrogenase (short-subunit alcohol dehydrogenase family)
MSLEGCRIVVTGAASGIGTALAERGAEVIGLDRRKPDQGMAAFCLCDLSDPGSIDAAVGAVAGPLHGLANVAGVPGSADGETVMRVNLLGLRHLTEVLLPRLAPGGAVVQVASGAGSGWRDNLGQVRALLSRRSFADGLAWVRANPMSGPQAYGFSKECVIVYALMGSMMARPYGVRSVSLSPGVVDTPILADFEDTMGKAILDRLTAQSGGRNARPGDIAPVIAFLMGKDAGWINGTDIGVDGGSEVAIGLDLLEVEADTALEHFLGAGGAGS